MSSTSTTTSLSFKPWSNDKGEEPPLKAILERIAHERGHFRDITEASLQEEIAAEGGLELSSSDDEDEEQDEVDTKDNKRQPAKDRSALYEAKNEMLINVNEAHRNIKNSLWFIGMLQSKYQPNIAGVSLSKEIKAMAPYGSLAADVWAPKSATKEDSARLAQDALLATNVRMRELHESADSLLAAATRLQDNVRKESQFWEQVMSVSAQGWRISRILGTHQLGVHYGFQGCDPAFARSEVAAITTDSDGNISLERGIGTRPRAIRATIRKAGQILGCSRLPLLPDKTETTLEARIRHARDSVFDEELFHEMLRESRALTSLGITVRGSVISFGTEMQEDVKVELELTSLDEVRSQGLEPPHELDTLAQAILLTARLLLSQEHRNRLNKKKEIPLPLSNKQEDNGQNSAILRPLILVLEHQAQVRKLNSYFGSMCDLLRGAGVSVESQSARISLPLAKEGSISTRSLVTSLLRPIKAEGIIWVIASDETTLELRLAAESLVSNIPGSWFTIQAQDGQNVTLFNLEDLLQAADDFLALSLVQLLKEQVGEGWTLDKREGTLTKERERAEKQVLWVTVDGEKREMTLWAHTSQGRKELAWKLPVNESARTLSDGWKDLVV